MICQTHMKYHAVLNNVNIQFCFVFLPYLTLNV